MLAACTTSSEVGRFNAEAGAGGVGGSGGEGQGGFVPVEPSYARLAASSSSTCAIASSGQVLCWGDNSFGQLGSGQPIESSDTPVPAVGLGAQVRAVFGGHVVHCAITNDGAALCWGDSIFEIVDGKPVHDSTNTPVEVPGVAPAASMAIGLSFQCALTIDGGVKCYGFNSAGQIGNGALDDSYEPASVQGLEERSTQIAAARAGFSACAVTSGAARCWGSNKSGQLGNGSKDDAPSAVQVLGLESGVTAVTVGRDHACALAGAGVKCWGDNGWGQLGIGSYQDQTSPVDVGGLPPTIAIGAGVEHTCALSDGGAIHCWGDDGFTNYSNAPTEVIGSGVVEMVVGTRHTCALLSNGKLRCWGWNDSGQLGPFDGAGAPL